MPSTIQPTLADVPETTLWTLYNRANEAARADGCLRDPKCLEIYHALSYDYARHFDKNNGCNKKPHLGGFLFVHRLSISSSSPHRQR